jgi:hypothetical protein
MIINTIDSFQGQEADLVFVSTVRSLMSKHIQLSGLGFAKDQRRSNVMLSRALQQMVIVGDAVNLAQEHKKNATLLLPSLVHWCVENDSMYTCLKSSLVPFTSIVKPLASQLLDTAPEAMNIPITIVRPVPIERIATPVTQALYSALDDFGKAIVALLIDTDSKAMEMSQLATLIPKATRQGHRSFIVPVRRISCVSLRQEDKGGWMVSLSVTPQCCTLDQLLCTAPAAGTNEFFVRQVRELLARRGGRMCLSDLGQAIPKAQRPMGKRYLQKLLSHLFGSELTVLWDGILYVQDAHALANTFVTLIRNSLMRGETMRLSTLGSIIPMDQRPQSSKNFRELVKSSMGSEICFSGSGGDLMITRCLI